MKNGARARRARARRVPPGVVPSIWSALIPSDNALTQERVALGHKLHFDTRLSADGTDAPKNPEQGQKIADELMRKWKAKNPNVDAGLVGNAQGATYAEITQRDMLPVAQQRHAKGTPLDNGKR